MDNGLTLDNFLLPYQKTFAEASQKRKLWLSARQIGKSFDLAYLATRAVLTSTRGSQALALCISTGARAASELLKKVVQMAEAVHIIDSSITYSCSMDKVQFSNGARVVSLPSGNPAGLRGYTADIVIIDEASYIENPEDVWSSIAPTLTRNSDAQLVLASTPAGKASWFYKLYEEAVDSKDWYVQTTTIEDAVRDGLAVDIEALKKTISDPDVWDREYMCQFAQEFGNLIDTQLLEFADQPQEVKARWMGMDVGSRSDRSAVVTLAQLADGTFFVEDAAILNKASYEHQLQVLKDLYAKYSWTAGFIDQNGIGSALAEFATKQVTSKVKGFTWTGTNKTPSYEALRAKIFDHKLKFARHLRDLVVQDFSNVHRVVSEAGKVTYEAGRDSSGHSDFTSALVLALQAATQSPQRATLPSAMQMRSLFGLPMGSAFGN